MLELIDIIRQVDLMPTYRTFYSSTKQYTFFPALMELSSKLTIYSDIKHILSDTRKLKQHPVSYNHHRLLKLDINNNMQADMVLGKELKVPRLDRQAAGRAH